MWQTFLSSSIDINKISPTHPPAQFYRACRITLEPPIWCLNCNASLLDDFREIPGFSWVEPIVSDEVVLRMQSASRQLSGYIQDEKNYIGAFWYHKNSNIYVKIL